MFCLISAAHPSIHPLTSIPPFLPILRSLAAQLNIGIFVEGFRFLPFANSDKPFVCTSTQDRLIQVGPESHERSTRPLSPVISDPPLAHPFFPSPTTSPPIHS